MLRTNNILEESITVNLYNLINRKDNINLLSNVKGLGISSDW